jgi:glycosyltransferase involved in cell wall biosynthesis
MNRPTIVHVITKLENGGAQRHALHILEHLPKDRYRVILAYGPGGYLDAQAQGLEGVEHWPIQALQRSIEPAQDLKALFEIRSRLRSLKDSLVIVHTHSSKAGVLGRLGATLSQVKARIHTVHGFGFHAGKTKLSKRLLKLVEKRSAKLSDWNLCVSEHDLRLGVRYGLLKEENTSIIHAGVDLEAHARDPQKGGDLRRELNIPDDAPVTSTIACLKPQKAPLDFVRFARRVKELVPNAHFIYVGDGELKQQLLEELQCSPSLNDSFHFLGWTDRIVDVLSASNVFVLLSLWEGLPRAIIEARAAQLPCVVTRICGNPEAVKDGFHGMLVPPGRPASAAEQVVKLFRTPQMLDVLHQNAHDGLDRFHIKHVVPKHIELYERLLAE